MDKSLPQTVEDAVDRLLSDLSLNTEIYLSMMDEDILTYVHLSLGHYIRNSFDSWTGNEALMESCRRVSGNANLHEDDASMVIVKELWKRLKSSNILDCEEAHGKTA